MSLATLKQSRTRNNIQANGQSAIQENIVREKTYWDQTRQNK